MVKINTPPKRAIILLVIFFLGLYIGYFFGKTREEQRVSQEERQDKAKLEISADLKKVEPTDSLQVNKTFSEEDKQRKLSNNLSYNQKLPKVEKLSKNHPPILRKININTAGVKELTKLPRIGEKIAQNIIDYRKQNGPFKDTKDLLKVKRIGPKILAMIQDMITVGDE